MPSGDRIQTVEADREQTVEADQNRVYIVSADGEAVYRPSSFRTPAGGVMRNVEWISYGGEIALGNGLWYGRRTTFQLTTISDCRDHRAYLYVIHTGGGGKPPPFPVSHCRDPEVDIANPP